LAEYFSRDFEHSFSSLDLRDADPETQLEVMEAWFRQNFEDPAQQTPYESAEGGYQYIWGGPYDAKEELTHEFSGVVPDQVIERLAVRLERENPEWAPTSFREAYDDFIAEDISRITQFHHHFTGGVLDIEKLLETEVAESVASSLWRMLYVNVITVLETYLSDAFISTVMNDSTLMRRLIETTPEFQAEKVPLSDVFKALESIEQRARSHLVDTVWHNLERVKPMYRGTLGVAFPEAGALFRAVLVRHDIVHRNGRTKSGDEIVITPEDVRTLISAVEEFVQDIDEQVSELRAKPGPQGQAPTE
jgi:hypothetical protein